MGREGRINECIVTLEWDTKREQEAGREKQRPCAAAEFSEKKQSWTCSTGSGFIGGLDRENSATPPEPRSGQELGKGAHAKIQNFDAEERTRKRREKEQRERERRRRRKKERRERKRERENAREKEKMQERKKTPGYCSG